MEPIPIQVVPFINGPKCYHGHSQALYTWTEEEETLTGGKICEIANIMQISG